MAICSYCGEKSGWLRGDHEECIRTCQVGMDVLRTEVESAILVGKPFADINSRLREIAASHFVSKDRLNATVKTGFSNAAEKMALDGVVDFETLKAIDRFGADAGFTGDEVGQTKGFLAAFFAVMLRDLVNGTPVETGQHCPFKLDEGEDPIFWSSALYLKDTLQRSRQGSYGGVSVPLGQGFRYHIGNFESHPVESHRLEHIDSGKLLVATQNVYFEGEHTAIQLPYAKIMSLRSYEDAVGIFRNGTRAKLEVFIVGAGIPYTTSTIFKMIDFLASSEGRNLYSLGHSNRSPVGVRESQ